MRKKNATGAATRFVVGYDTDARFEECNGEPRPLTEEEYRDNEYMKDGKPIAYSEYLAYYGNPDRHVYLYVQRQDRCKHCGSWINGDAVWSIDVMDDNVEALMIGTFTIDELSGYLRQLAEELEKGDQA